MYVKITTWIHGQPQLSTLTAVTTLEPVATACAVSGRAVVDTLMASWALRQLVVSVVARVVSDELAGLGSRSNPSMLACQTAKGFVNFVSRTSWTVKSELGAQLYMQ